MVKHPLNTITLQRALPRL